MGNLFFFSTREEFLQKLQTLIVLSRLTIVEHLKAQAQILNLAGAPRIPHIIHTLW